MGYKAFSLLKLTVVEFIPMKTLVEPVLLHPHYPFIIVAPKGQQYHYSVF